MKQDLFMWVGSQFYPTISHFIREAKMQGCSKRVPRFPINIIQGKSRVFLAHDEGYKGQGVIFGYFIIEKVQIIVPDNMKAEVRELLRKKDIEPVSVSEARLEPVRGCGKRSVGGCYI